MFSVCWKWMFDRHTAATSCSALTSCWMRISNPGFWKSTYHRGETHLHTHTGTAMFTNAVGSIFFVSAASTPTQRWMFPLKVRWSKTSSTWLASVCPEKKMWWPHAAAPPAALTGIEGGDACHYSIVITSGGGKKKTTTCNYLGLNLVKMCWNNICV